MTDSNAEGLLDSVESQTTLSDEEGMATLRSLVLGPAEAQIAEVHARLADPNRQLEEVSHVLPAAIAIRSRRDSELTEALAPTVAAAVERSVRKDPKPLVDAIFPLMGPAIRKAIAAALSGMVQSFNYSLSHSLSFKGLRWRFESMRTGKPFGEVVLLHTLLYRVEQVFLIHKETGLLLHEVSAPGVTKQDPDMVSAMLTAIQDFVHDSFAAPRGDQLETLQVGELTVWVEQGPSAVLAAVIRGNAPQELRTIFQETLERIHLEFGDALGQFKGDAAPFAEAAPLLENCLQSQLDSTQRAAARKLTPFSVIVSILLVLLLVWGFFWLRERRRWNAAVERLRSEPGIVVTNAEKQGGSYVLNGLRDPLSHDPQLILQEFKIDPKTVASRWEPFYALSPEFLLARAKSYLNPPNTVELSMQDGVLQAEGFALHQWVVTARQAVRLLPGPVQFREDNLLDLNRIEDPLLLFQFDSSALVPGQEEKLKLLAADIGRLQAEAQRLHKNVVLEISGHTDGSGTEARNRTLSLERAQTIADTLRTMLPQLDNVNVKAVGSEERLYQEITEADRATNRNVTFKVIVSEAQ
ncbi:MAG TPA: OmpA family protein [Pyrinomonadaceae bacterium]|nr:OmpA family protein [Pyrinomonadaceae bacterium]